MTKYSEPIYKTKITPNSQPIETSLEEHLEVEHELHYLTLGLDFLGLDGLEKIHKQIHKAYFDGFNAGVNSGDFVDEGIIENYSYSSLADDIQFLPD